MEKRFGRPDKREDAVPADLVLRRSILRKSFASPPLDTGRSASTIVRFFSIYGPGLRKQIFWDLCAKIRNSKDTISMSGTGDETRDFIHVADAARLLAALAQKPRTAQPGILNGGTGRATTICEAVGLMAAACGADLHISFDGVQRAGDPLHLVADVSKLGRIGFRPLIGLDKGLSDYVDWRDRDMQNQRGSAPARLAEKDLRDR